MYKYCAYMPNADLAGAIDWACKLGTPYMETGDLLSNGNDFCSYEQVETMKDALIDSQKILVCMHTNRRFDDKTQMEWLKRAIHLGVRHIKPIMDESIVSDGEKQEAFFSLCQKASVYGMRVLVENQASQAGVIGYFERLFKNPPCNPPGFIFNPLEYVKQKKHPFFHAFYQSRLKNDLVLLRTVDGYFKTGQPTCPGMGNAEIKEMISILKARGFDGWLSIDYNEDWKEWLIHLKQILKSM